MTSLLRNVGMVTLFKRAEGGTRREACRVDVIYLTGLHALPESRREIRGATDRQFDRAWRYIQSFDADQFKTFDRPVTSLSGRLHESKLAQRRQLNCRNVDDDRCPVAIVNDRCFPKVEPLNDRISVPSRLTVRFHSRATEARRHRASTPVHGHESARHRMDLSVPAQRTAEAVLVSTAPGRGRDPHRRLRSEQAA